MHPYSDLPPNSFWRTAIAEVNPLEIDGLWRPKFTLNPDDTVITAGSCFAQHISRALAGSGYSWLDAEPAPDCASEALKKKFNYGVFSFRTGNIYTTLALLQWCRWALGEEKVPEEVWRDSNGRYFDPFRPNIEPSGFGSIGELTESREATLLAIKNGIQNAKVFVFTLGLTETWRNIEHGYYYPLCPGTFQGTFDSDKHEFVNLRYPDIRSGMQQAIQLMKKINPELKFLLTVSPVPLTATASGDHVLTATTNSKSILRAVAGDLAATRDDTDYFPSYEIISSFPFRAMFFEPNMRSVSKKGVEFVMNTFFRAIEGSPKKAGAGKNAATKKKAPSVSNHVTSTNNDDVICEEELLDAFS